MAEKKDSKNMTKDEISELIKSLFAFDLEIETLKNLTYFTESIRDKLKLLYGEKFPKKCNCCGRVYETRAEYLKITRSLNGPGTIFDQNKVQEYRDCVCGSTLLIVTHDRRGEGEFEKARRKLFDLCVEKFEKLSLQDRKDIIPVVRIVFQCIIRKTQLLENQEDYELKDLA